MQGGRQEWEHRNLCLGRTRQPYSARGHHQADQRVRLFLSLKTDDISSTRSDFKSVFSERRMHTHACS